MISTNKGEVICIMFRACLYHVEGISLRDRINQDVTMYKLNNPRVDDRELILHMEVEGGTRER